MIIIHSELLGSAFVCVVTVSVIMCTIKFDSEDNKKKINTIFKAALLSFGLTYITLYFMTNAISDEVISNILKTEPTF